MRIADFEIFAPEFANLFPGHVKLEKLFTGARWAEGPAYFPAHRALVFSDIPNDRMLRFDEETASVAVFRKPSNNSNGNTVDRQGRLVRCEHGARRVTRTEHDGSITVIADAFRGKRLNSPNDLVVKSDGSIWFTDPPYGILADYEGHKSAQEIEGCHVYRVDPSGEIAIAADDFVKPNGIAFSPDESHLYVADTGASHDPDGPRHIRRFKVGKHGKLSGGKVFAECTEGLFDGFRFDDEGRIWTSARDGVHCLDASGALIGKIHVPEIVANVCFGDPKRNRLYICGQTSLYSVYLNVNGAKTF